MEAHSVNEIENRNHESNKVHPLNDKTANTNNSAMPRAAGKMSNLDQQLDRICKSSRSQLFQETFSQIQDRSHQRNIEATVNRSTTALPKNNAMHRSTVMLKSMASFQDKSMKSPNNGVSFEQQSPVTASRKEGDQQVSLQARLDVHDTSCRLLPNILLQQNNSATESSNTSEEVKFDRILARRLRGQFQIENIDKQRTASLMLFTIFIIIVISWSPIAINFVIDPGNEIPSIVYVAFTILAWTNSCINIFVYAGMSRKFRDAYWRLFHGRALDAEKYSKQRPSVKMNQIIAAHLQKATKVTG